jgi:hypothetical protein
LPYYSATDALLGEKMLAANRVLRALVSLAVVAGVLLAVPLTAPPAQAAPKTTISPTKPIKNELFTVTGSLGGVVARPVVLQRRSGSKWRTIAASTTTTTGAYKLTATTAKAITVRVMAPAAVLNGHSYAPIIGHTKKVSTVKQRISFTMPTSSSVNQAISATVKLTPVRKNRIIKLQVRTGGRWRDVTTQQANTSSKITIRLAGAAAGTFTYRVVAAASNGAPALASGSRKMTIKPDKSVVDPDARPLTTSEVSKITSYDPASGTLVFANPPRSAKSITRGDILPIPPRTGIASGALRKVTSTTQKGTTTTVHTTSASLPEAITNIPDSATKVALSATSPGTFVPAGGVTIQPRTVPQSGFTKASAAGVTPAANHTIELGLNISKSTPEFKGTLTGTITLDPYSVIDLNIDWGHVKSFKVGAGVVANSNLTTKFTSTASTNAKITLGRLTQMLGGMIGPVPVWLENDLELIVEISATGTISVSTAASGTLEAGVTGGSTAESLSIYTSGTAVNGKITDFKTALEASTFVGPKDVLSIYSLAGPYIQVGLKARIFVSHSTAEQWKCGARVGPHLEAGLTTGEAIKALTGTTFKLSAEAIFNPAEKDYCTPDGRPIGGGTSDVTPPPAVGISTASLPDGLVGESYDAYLTATGGDGTYTWTASGLPAGLSISPSGHISGTPTQGGTTSIHVAVTSSGKSSESDVTIRVVAPNAKERQAVMVAAGREFTCVLTKAGGVKCWGSNLDDQLGTGTNLETSAEPVDVSGLTSGVASIAASYAAACAVTVGGDAYCWGHDLWEQTGPESSTSPTPHLVATGVKAISGGMSHFCAITQTGRVECWGENSSGALGTDTGGEPSDVPLLVDGVTNAQTISAGTNTTCALTGAGAICWGDNFRGAVNGHPDMPADGHPVTLASSYLAISTGTDYTCGVKPDHTVDCWGFEDQLNLNGAAGLTEVATIATGERWACVTTTTGGVKCWGSYGNPEIVRWHDLTTILTSSAAQVSVARGHACAVTNTGGVKCWGESTYDEGPGAHSTDTPVDRGLTPVDIPYFG